jgi:hypothetical protein
MKKVKTEKGWSMETDTQNSPLFKVKFIAKSLSKKKPPSLDH